jgi:hypothetical protein
VNATAYAAKFKDGRMIVAIINKDAVQDLQIAMPGWRVAQRLTAESLTSTTVKFGAVAAARGIAVPAASAAILQRVGR